MIIKKSKTSKFRITSCITNLFFEELKDRQYYQKPSFKKRKKENYADIDSKTKINIDVESQSQFPDFD